MLYATSRSPHLPQLYTDTNTQIQALPQAVLGENPSCNPCPPDPDARPLQASLDKKPQASTHLQRKTRLKKDRNGPEQIRGLRLSPRGVYVFHPGESCMKSGRAVRDTGLAKAASVLRYQAPRHQTLSFSTTFQAASGIRASCSGYRAFKAATVSGVPKSVSTMRSSNLT